MSVFSDHVEDLMSPALADAFGDTVAYTPTGQTALASLTAIIGPTEVLVDGSVLVALAHENRDFSIKTSDLIVDGGVYEPRRGDVITEVKGGKTYTYTVLVPSGLEDCWTWADRFRIRRKIHAKLAEVA